MKTSRIAAVLLLILLTFGCARRQVINMDGMPVSNHEYNLTNEETSIRAVFVLARYFREYEAKEYIIKADYLDALHANRIDPRTTERLILHIKVINLRKQYYTMNWETNQPKGGKTIALLYGGKLSRKDFSMEIPTAGPGENVFQFRVLDMEANDLYSLPLMRYKVKGGAEAKRQ
jgi:hypothetical protein